MLAVRKVWGVVFCVWANCASGQGLDGLLVCKAIENEVARLNCYDAQAAKLGLSDENGAGSNSPSTGELTNTGKWKVESGTDPLTDKQTFLAVLESSTAASFRPPTFLIRCNGGVSELFISWGDYLNDNTSVTSRFGTDVPETSSWEGSTDKTATFLAVSRHNNFVNSLLSTDRYVAQIVPYQSGPVTAVFEIEGIVAVMKGNEKVCGLVSN